MKNVARVFSGFQTYSERCRSGAGEAWQGRRVDVGLKSAAEWDISAMDVSPMDWLQMEVIASKSFCLHRVSTLLNCSGKVYTVGGFF